MITLVIGRRVQGKTTLAYHLGRKKPTLVIFDPRGTFSNSEISEIEIYERLDLDSQIVVHPEGKVSDSFINVCEAVKDWIRDNPGEPLAFLVDEARFIDSPSGVPESFDWIIRFSDPKIVDVLLTAHRPSDISVDIRAIADYWCIFRTTQEHDLKVIAERCGGEVADAVRMLGDREFVVWNDGLAKMHVNREPNSWYVALNSPETSEPGERPQFSEARG